MIPLREQAVLTANALIRMVEQGLPPGCGDAIFEHADDLMRAASLEALPAAGVRRLPCAVTITDEALVPDEFCTLQVTMSVKHWALIRREVTVFDQMPLPDSVRIGPRTPSLYLIAAELERSCERCDGAPAVGTKDACQWCGGSGKRGVPGVEVAQEERLRPAAGKEKYGNV